VTATISSRRFGHVPVLLGPVLEMLRPRDDALYLDGTFGAGGYTEALLAAARCRVVAIDRDPDAIAAGAPFHERFAGRITLAAGRFGDMEAIAGRHGVQTIDGGVVLDLGVSSTQLDLPERGFSFRHEGPLDMRMDKAGASAADVVNSASESELGRIVRDLGEERYWRRVARAIVEARGEKPLANTRDLAEVVRRAVPSSGERIDAATRTFQALRLYVNDELGELERGLEAAERLLAPGGRLVVVSFHSLEDRTVKTFLRARSGATAKPSRHLPAAEEPRAPSFRVLTRKPITPTDDEVNANPRARSARLRAAERTEAPAWSEREAA